MAISRLTYVAKTILGRLFYAREYNLEQVKVQKNFVYRQEDEEIILNELFNLFDSL